VVNPDFSQTLLNTILPKEALKIIKNSFLGTDDPIPRLLNNLDLKIEAYASKEPFYQHSRCIEFTELLRGCLAKVGSRADLNGFHSKPLGDSPLIEQMAAAAKQKGIDLEYGVCPAVRIEAGYARVTEAHILKMRCADIFLVSEFSHRHAHIIQARAVSNDTSGVTKICKFSLMICLLFMLGIPFISGKAAVSNTGCALMDKGEWRFEEQSTPFGFAVTKLERFWLAAGAIPARLAEEGNPYLYFLSEDRAFSFIAEYRKTHPELTSSPYCFASRYCIYDKETLFRLKNS